MSRKPHVTIYTDGSCLSNPGPGGFAAILVDDASGARKEVSGSVRDATNNRMELLAAITGLRALKVACSVTLLTDSQYLVNGGSGRWTRLTANKDLWKQLRALCTQHAVTFHWLRGHAGHPDNERCDRLARIAAEEADLSSVA